MANGAGIRESAQHSLSRLPRAVQHEMLENRHPRTPARELERSDQAASRDGLWTFARDVETVETHGAIEAVDETRDTIENRRLASAVGADQAGNDAGFDGEARTVKGADAAEARPDIAHLKQRPCRRHRSTSS